jgi:hypothetical protein
VRSTLKLEVPLCHDHHVLVDTAYIRTLVQIANGKMAENFERIAKFQAACAAAFAADIAAAAAARAQPIVVPEEAIADNAVVCSMCPETFASRNKLFKHLQSAHPRPA